MALAGHYHQRLSERFGDDTPAGVKLLAIGVSGVIFGGIAGASSYVLFDQQVPLILWKAVIGAIGVGLPVGLTGGILLMDPDTRLRYIGGGLFGSLGALALFEITYPVGWAARYRGVGTFMYATGVAVLLGLATWVMRDWFDDEEEVTQTESDWIWPDDRGRGEDDSEGRGTGAESVDPGYGEASADTTNDGGDADTPSRDEAESGETAPLAARVNDVNAEVERLGNQVNKLSISEFDAESKALEPRVEEVVDRVDVLLPEIVRLTNQVQELETNLGDLRSELDAVGSAKARSVGRIQEQVPGFRGHDGPGEAAPVGRSTRSARQRSASGDGSNRVSATRSRQRSQRRDRTGSRSTKQERTDPRRRPSTPPRGAAFAPRQASRGGSVSDTFEQDLYVKAVLTLLGIVVIVAVSFIVAAMT